MNILEEIAQSRHLDLLSIQTAIVELRAGPLTQLCSYRLQLSDKLKDRARIGIIAEVKPASPSSGVLLECLAGDSPSPNQNQILIPTVPDIEEIVTEMVKGGAIGISVLAEPRYFNGSYGNLLSIAKVTPKSIPILLKEFVVDESQLELGKECGASNALVLASIGDPLEMVALAEKHGLEPLIEIHTLEDLEKIADLAGTGRNFVIGVNNRNLADFTIDFQTTQNLVPQIREIFGDSQPIITESGIHAKEDLFFLASCGIQGALVGSALMHANIERKLRDLLGLPPLFVKICGISTLDTLIALDNPVATAFGCVVDVPGSIRNVGIKMAQELFAAAPAHLKKVLVTQDKTLEAILTLDKYLQPDLIQYHGTNALDYLPEYPQEKLVKIVVPIRFADYTVPELITLVQNLPDEVYAILLDSSEGKGRPINLAIAAKIVSKCKHKRIILAGNISTTNIGQIWSQIRPFGVDLSSSLEINGQKSENLIKQFLDATRSLNIIDVETR